MHGSLLYSLQEQGPRQRLSHQATALCDPASEEARVKKQGSKLRWSDKFTEAKRWRIEWIGL